ncbi:MAG TPA: hypothetical protein VD866_29135 [Urbifossiella sp.]|nr:hypothetical protein [Urbifossiella sp.]
MTARCPRCSTPVDFGALAADGRAYCPGCGTRLKLPPTAIGAAAPVPLDDAAPLAVLDPPPGPLFVPIPVGPPPELVREQVEDLRDRRDERRERRQNDRVDRDSNTTAIAGAAVTGTALLLVVSGALFAGGLKAYGWFAASFALMLTLVGLPLSLIGALQPGRQRVFAFAGAAAGGLLLLVLVPALMMYLSKLK